MRRFYCLLKWSHSMGAPDLIMTWSNQGTCVNRNLIYDSLQQNCHISHLPHKLITGICREEHCKALLLLLPVTWIQIVALTSPAVFLAVHPYWPASSKETWSMITVLLLIPRSTPSLVQLTTGGGSPSTVHFTVNVEFNGIDWFFNSGFSLGGT